MVFGVSCSPCMPGYRVAQSIANTSPCSASYVSCKRDTARICCWAPCCGPCCGAAAIGQYLPPARRSAANSPHVAAAVAWWDRQTDRQTDGRTHDRFLDSSPDAMRAVSVNHNGSKYITTYIFYFSNTENTHKISTYKNNKRTLVLWLNEGHNAS